MRGSSKPLILLSLYVALLLSTGTPAWTHPGLERQIVELTARVESGASSPDVFLRRGDLFRLHQDWARAEADFLRARELNPDLAAVDFFLGRLRLDMGQPKKARNLLNRFLLVEPDHAEALAVRARAWVLLDRPLDAAADLSAALESVERNGRTAPSFYLERARILAAAGKVDQAVGGLDEGLERLGYSVTLQLYAIELELRQSRYDNALKRLEQIASRSARQETWLVRRGEILEAAGRVEAARQSYLAALSAIDTLPASRRWNRAVMRLETQAQDAAQRLDEPGRTR